VVGRFEGGTVTASELAHEINRLPPLLRQQLDTATGRRQLVAALIDKRLLAAEARRRGLLEDAEIRRQIDELQERLTIQALLAAEDKAAGEPTEAEVKAWYDAHRGELAEPARARVSRVLAAVPPQAGDAERQRARGRAEQFLARLRKGEAMAAVARDGDGDERTRGGDLGFLVAGQGTDHRLVAAAMALEKGGALSGVVACDGGWAVLRLEERREPRVPTLEEARSQVVNRMAPARQRRAFDDLLTRLRSGAGVKVDLPEALR